MKNSEWQDKTPSWLPCFLTAYLLSRPSPEGRGREARGRSPGLGYFAFSSVLCGGISVPPVNKMAERKRASSVPGAGAAKKCGPCRPRKGDRHETKPRTGFHPHRAACGHCHERNPGCHSLPLLRPGAGEGASGGLLL